MSIGNSFGDEPYSLTPKAKQIFYNLILSTAQTEEIYRGKLYAYVVSNNADTLKVDGQSIGNTAMILVSSGSNLKFDEENADLEDWEYAQEGTTADFDDILLYLSANELASSVAWRREIEEELAILNQSARILAENDDRGDRKKKLRGALPVFCPSPHQAKNFHHLSCSFAYAFEENEAFV